MTSEVLCHRCGEETTDYRMVEIEEMPSPTFVPLCHRCEQGLVSRAALSLALTWVRP